MHIDLRTVTIKPLRHTFDNIARRLGADKPATRYQEGTLDMQQTVNFHYRPTWDPDHEIYDASRTAIKMADWYAFKDPRQFYYGAYTMARAKQQDTAEANFDFVENRGLAETLPADVRATVLELLVPLRHVAWGSNMNNASICAYSYGTAFSQPGIYQAMDQLGIAQYLTRVGLLLGGVDVLDEAKDSWMTADTWQGLRRYVEDCMVLKDPVELFVAQNVALDGLLYPLVYETIVDDVLSAKGGTPVAMLTQFMTDWFAETKRWTDATMKTAAAESAENKEILAKWVSQWRDRAAATLLPVARIALNERTDELVAEVVQQFNARLVKAGVPL
ncbi:aromatic/alkene monooxygenase hydroxylase subunit beta [Cognatazoarcus halotolerans]|uniref:aromatic/alkene monooxygenase hydroxylase subunit beta n=1 Tax=Cognatazoarcus halotolerans TaxID=2686016 RepID=UPI00135B4EA4|nr:aromatic/alkene monooxygenase hydroxylase subunit beta [Cognatazoarcus halotolerans]MBX3679797.1 aromatic/alkene monooxygenase hydroxylase subunit beta [Rhodocyclaceae bacterium]MCB1902268.1 aromatic/alkene monooxygenase hydroxylase subunit beta [Rhodocyclaceae bacterium]MCP5309946.1 phenol hydroxylase [Zoogloeaceae bacterium]